MLFRVKEKCYIRPYLNRPVGGLDGDRLVEPDVIIGDGPGSAMPYDGPPAPFLEPLDQEAREATAAFFETNPHAQLDPVKSLAIDEPIESVGKLIKDLTAVLAPLVKAQTHK